MRKAQSDPRPRALPEQGMALLAFAILAAYSYALFFQRPYTGFLWSSSKGEVTWLFVGGSLQLGDRMLQIGPVLLSEVQSNLRQTIFENYQPGQVVPLVVERAGQRLTLNWTMPGFNFTEFWSRIFSQWPFAWMFWFIGELVLLVVRPKDARWRLLAAFNFVTAVWLAASMLSAWQIWGSPFVLRWAIWLSLPVYLHLHWIFPKPLKPLSAFVGWGLYAAALALAVAEWFQLLPRSAYLIGLLLAVVGSSVLLFAHLFRAEQRREVGLVFWGAALALLPSIGIVVSSLFFPSALVYATGAVIFLPLLPLSYVYAISRHQFGGLELRVNQFVTYYLLVIVLGLLVVLPVAVADNWLDFPGDTPIIILLGIILTVLIVMRGFPLIRRFVERAVFAMPLPPHRLVQAHAARVATRLDRPGLAQIIEKQVMPSLLVRQSALVYFHDNSTLAVLYQTGLEEGDLPTEGDLQDLIAHAGRYHPRRAGLNSGERCDWVRLTLLLQAGDELLGLWLLGRRDPDDYYAPSDIRSLQAIASQTAVALSNISQADRLRALHEAHIDQQEAERAALSRELHDVVLADLGALGMRGDYPPEFDAVLKSINTHLRDLIRNLRPLALDLGLRLALDELADEVRRDGNGVSPRLELGPSDARYPLHVEQYVFRIAQQAVHNTLRHARAKTVRLYGRLEPDEIDLTVEDDGQGFELSESPDRAGLLAQGHYGLVGMMERAEIIGARLSMRSMPGEGTRVRVTWKRGKPRFASRS